VKSQHEARARIKVAKARKVNQELVDKCVELITHAKGEGEKAFLIAMGIVVLMLFQDLKTAWNSYRTDSNYKAFCRHRVLAESQVTRKALQNYFRLVLQALLVLPDILKELAVGQRQALLPVSDDPVLFGRLAHEIVDYKEQHGAPMPVSEVKALVKREYVPPVGATKSSKPKSVQKLLPVVVRHLEAFADDVRERGDLGRDDFLNVDPDVLRRLEACAPLLQQLVDLMPVIGEISSEDGDVAAITKNGAPARPKKQRVRAVKGDAGIAFGSVEMCAAIRPPWD
jgi:hypothetical protein